MLKFHIWSIGCQMNTADARRAADELESYGLQEVDSLRQADVVVLFSCMVRQRAEDKVHSQLGELRRLKAKRPELKIAMGGCIGDVAAWSRRYPFVDYFLPPGQDLTYKDRLVDLLELDDFYRPRPEGAVRLAGVSEGITIHQGCNRSCTYCIVPFTRGRERSRTPAEVLAEARHLVSRGTREVVLLSQIVERYGRDLRPRVTLAELLAMLDAVDGLQRIRFLTSYPGDFGRDLIEAVATLPKVCEDLNIPIQSGDNGVLTAMKRGYTVESYLDLISRIRARIPDVAISTDVIVGFPGESEAAFLNTLKVLEEVRFDVVHVAAFSPRPGTPAAEYPDQVPFDERRRRLHAVESLQRRISEEINQGYVGRCVEVLVEGRAKGAWYGRTRTNKLVHFADPRDLGGQMAQVLVTRAGPWSLQGTPVTEAAA